MQEENTKFCKHCGKKIVSDAVICTKCGRQVEDINAKEPQNIVINNSANASASATSSGPAYNGREKNKWVSLLLCVFTICGHKFYEGKIGMGFIYLFTFGLLGVGWIIDIITLIGKPNPYYV